jgi:hypothetical protein
LTKDGGRRKSQIGTVDSQTDMSIEHRTRSEEQVSFQNMREKQRSGQMKEEEVRAHIN